MVITGHGGSRHVVSKVPLALLRLIRHARHGWLGAKALVASIIHRLVLIAQCVGPRTRALEVWVATHVKSRRCFDQSVAGCLARSTWIFISRLPYLRGCLLSLLEVGSGIANISSSFEGVGRAVLVILIFFLVAADDFLDGILTGEQLTPVAAMPLVIARTGVS